MKINSKIINYEGAVADGYTIENGAFVVQTLTDRDNIPEKYRSNCLATVIDESLIAVYTGTDFVDASWTNVSNWLSVGGTTLEQQGSNLTVYVNGTTGDDNTADGTSGLPFASITAAIEFLKDIINGATVTVDVAAGSYTEYNLFKAVRRLLFLNGGKLIISGATAEVLSSRSWTGNMVLTTGTTFSATENEYEGNFIRTSGDDLHPIIYNNASDVVHAAKVNLSANAYSIRSLQTTINLGSSNYIEEFNASNGAIEFNRLKFITSNTLSVTNIAKAGTVRFNESSISALKLVLNNVFMNRCYIKVTSDPGILITGTSGIGSCSINSSSVDRAIYLDHSTLQYYNNTVKQATKAIELLGENSSLKIGWLNSTLLESDVNGFQCYTLIETITSCFKLNNGTSLNLTDFNAVYVYNYQYYLDTSDGYNIYCRGSNPTGDTPTTSWVNGRQESLLPQYSYNVLIEPAMQSEISQVSGTFPTSTGASIALGQSVASLLECNCVIVRNSNIIQFAVKVLYDETDVYVYPPIGDDLSLADITAFDAIESGGYIYLSFTFGSAVAGATYKCDIKRMTI